MDLRLGNQQRHSITAVLLSTVVVIFGLVIADMLQDDNSDPLGTLTKTAEKEIEADEPTVDSTVEPPVARSNSRFTLSSEVTASARSAGGTDDGNTTTSTIDPSTAAPARSTTPTSTRASSTLDDPGPPTSAVGDTTVVTRSPDISTTTETTVKGKGPPNSKPCRGNKPACRNP